MKFVTTSFTVGIVILLVLASGCADVSVTKKVGDFGTAFGASPDEQKAIDWFKTTYGDPTANNNDPARFVEPLITSGLNEKNLPLDKVTTFPVSGGSVYFFVIYDNFRKGDPITVSWVYLENGKEVTSVRQQAGGDFGRFIVEFQKPDTGWGKGRQRITVSGNGATASVEFAIGDALQTTALPYNPAGGQGPSGLGGQPSMVQKPGEIAGENIQPPSGIAGPITSVTTALTGADLSSDPKNCGSIGNVCPAVPYAISTCSGGKCGHTCKANYADCNKNPADGCEAYLGVDPNCGSCGNVCQFDHGLGACSDSQCVLERCENGWSDCNENPADGCETNIATSHENCGSCGRACKSSDVCQKSNCVYSCTGGKTLCGMSCVDLKTDSNNCGSCGHVCQRLKHAWSSCIDSKCNGEPGATLTCSDGFASCDGNNQDGCETALFDMDNCGSCGHRCIEGIEHCHLDSQIIINVDYWPYTDSKSKYSCHGNIFE